ncbi:MAG TPA: glycosyltransferase family 87 protein [Tepidisphaeraceae bacterium]|nr:glycosyltransferase family 87 protein [Tepidisphaeraceae bacterium]
MATTSTRNKPRSTGLVGTLFPRKRVRVASAGLLIICIALSGISFATSKDGKTLFGPPLGADFAGFYVVGEIYNQYGPASVYDLDLQSKLYHELLPHEPATASLPYAHAPLLVPAFAQLAKLPYPQAYFTWLILSMAIYCGGIVLLLSACPKLSDSDRLTAILLAVSFEPFIMECWHGGQIAVIGFLALSAAFWCLRRERMLCAGIALSFCIYKPTLLVVVLPMLVFMRQWRMLMGFAIGASYLELLSMVILTPSTCLAHLNLLLHYAQRTTSGGTFFQTQKYVDFNSFVKLLLPGSAIAPIVLGALMGLSALLLGRVLSKVAGEPDRSLLVATAIAWTMVLNLYIALYDTICIVPVLFVAAEYFLGKERRLPMPFRLLLVGTYIAPCVTQTIARWTGLQLYTIVLAMGAIYLLLQLRPAGERKTAHRAQLAMAN